MSESIVRGANPTDFAPDVSLTEIHSQTLTSMRATDDISLKLLGAVPLVSGVGITLLTRQQSGNLPATARSLVGLFAAIVTFAIYRWERRNMSHCRRFRKWAAEVEKAYLSGLPTESNPEIGKAPHDDTLSTTFFARRWGKTQAEELLYTTVISAWLATSLYVVAI